MPAPIVDLSQIKGSKGHFIQRQTDTTICLSKKPELSQMVSCPEEGRKISTNSPMMRENITPAPERGRNKAASSGVRATAHGFGVWEKFPGRESWTWLRMFIAETEVVLRMFPASSNSHVSRGGWAVIWLERIEHRGGQEKDQSQMKPPAPGNEVESLLQ